MCNSQLILRCTRTPTPNSINPNLPWVWVCVCVCVGKRGDLCGFCEEIWRQWRDKFDKAGHCVLKFRGSRAETINCHDATRVCFARELWGKTALISFVALPTPNPVFIIVINVQSANSKTDTSFESKTHHEGEPSSALTIHIHSTCTECKNAPTDKGWLTVWWFCVRGQKASIVTGNERSFCAFARLKRHRDKTAKLEVVMKINAATGWKKLSVAPSNLLLVVNWYCRSRKCNWSPSEF